MKNKVVFAIMAVLLLAVPTFGCITDDTKTAASGLAVDLAAAKTQSDANTKAIKDLTDTVSKKADATRVDAIFDKLGTTGNANSYSKGETYTQAEVNQKIADAVNALKNDQSWIKGTGGTTVMPSGSDTGVVVFTNNPVAIPQIFSSSSGGNSNPWIMTIVNQGTTWQYVKPVVQLNIASGQSASIVQDITILVSGGSCTMTGSYLTSITAPVPPASATNAFSFSPSNMNGTATPSVVMMPISGCNGSGEIQIGPGQSQSVNIQIQNLKTANPVLWNVTANVSSRSM